MHRSRLIVLAMFAAAGCSTHDDARGTDLLSNDRTLVARLEADEHARRLALPAACGAVTPVTPPAAAKQREAEALTRRADVEEMHGNLDQARSLWRRASELDGTSKSAAYHLGRTNEALGDRAAAVNAYCRYLALTPTTAESDEARRRVADLSQRVARVSPAGVSNGTTTTRRIAATTVRRPARVRSAVSPSVVASPAARQSGSAIAAGRGERVAGTSASGASDSQREIEPGTTSSTADGAHSASAGGDVVATREPTPDVAQPTTTSPTSRRRVSRGQGAVIGAATGAIIGAATGRSVKSAVIGAAAGGILGTIVVRGNRVADRGVLPWMAARRR